MYIQYYVSLFYDKIISVCLTFRIDRDSTILKMAIFDEVNNIDIEPAQVVGLLSILTKAESTHGVYFSNNYWS